MALYEVDLDRARSLSQEALALARASGDDAALVEALRARQEVSPGPAGRPERLRLAEEMLDVARHTGSRRTAMWGRLWRLDALVEQGDLEAAEAQLAPLRIAVDQVGGPVSAWLLDRSTACVAQARADFATASSAGRRAFERMRSIEPQAARGAYLALRCAVSHHVGASDESVALAQQPFHRRRGSPPWAEPDGRSSSLGPDCSKRRPSSTATPVRSTAGASRPSGVVSCLAVGTMAAAALDRADDLAVLLARLQEYRGQHATVGAGVVNYLGPVELHLGVGALALGRTDSAADDLRAALETSRRSNTPGSPPRRRTISPSPCWRTARPVTWPRPRPWRRRAALSTVRWGWAP